MAEDHGAQPGKKRIQRVLLAGLLIALLSLVVFFGVKRIRQRITGTPPEQVPPLAVETLRLQPGPFVVSRRYTGSIEAVHRAKIAAQVSARVREVNFREGETVQEGELLVVLDDTELRAEVGRLEATARRIQADLDFWKKQAARDKKLLSGKAIPPQKYDESKRMKASVAASLRANDYALAAARARLGYTRIHAPFSGKIQRLDTEVGELAAPGKILVELVAPRPLKAVISVPQKDLAEIREGMEVRLVVPAANQVIDSRIDHIYPVLDPATRNATIEAGMPDPGKVLSPGMAVDANVILARTEHALVLPHAAVRMLGGQTGVFAVKHDQALWLPVTVGLSMGGRVQILSGLKGGETVIVTPDPRLSDGTPVRPRNTWRSTP